jgi:hypothetical protein
MIRVSDLTTTGGTAVLCGVDLGAPRTLFMARVDFSGAGSLSELTSSPIQPTFSIDPGAANWAEAHSLNVATEGDQITCRLTSSIDPSEIVEIGASDSTLASGSAGFFALGTAVDFHNVAACGDPP